MSEPVKLGSLLVFAGLASVAFAAAGRLEGAPPVPALSGRAMGTTWSVKWIQPERPIESAIVARRVADRLEQLEQQFSTYRPDSELSRFNRASRTDWIPVSPALAAAAARAREISELTGGAFDVTVAPLLQLWGFGPYRGRDTWPAAAEITAARAGVGWRQLEARLDPPALRKTVPAVSADFSSLAKGFAVDQLSAQLSSLGLSNHLVQIGGDLKATGPGSSGQGWRVAIEQPIENASTVARVLTLSNQALSTSGDHRNIVTLGGRRAGHILDPRTGLPAASGLAAVSVIDASCATSSALATGLFVLGPEGGHALAVQKNLACLCLVREGATLVQRATPEFERKAATQRR